jgi:hypothetical protein
LKPPAKGADIPKQRSRPTALSPSST